MDYCRVVGPRGLCRPLDEKQGFPTNTSPLAPCEDCSKACKERLFEFQGRRQGRLVQKPEGGAGLGTSGPGGPGSLELPKMFVFGHFSGTLAGSPPRTGAGSPRSLDSASLGPQTPLGGTPHTPKSAKKCVLAGFSRKLAGWPLGPARVPGFCQPGAPDRPGGTPQTPQDRPKTPQW